MRVSTEGEFSRLQFQDQSLSLDHPLCRGAPDAVSPGILLFLRLESVSEIVNVVATLRRRIGQCLAVSPILLLEKGL